MSTCPNCNKQFDDATKFCDVCGTAVIETAEAPAAEAAPAKKLPDIKLPFNLNKKVLALGAAALAAILVIAIVVSTFFTPAPSYIIYAKDGDVMYYDESGKPWVAVEDAEDEGLEGQPYVTADGKKMFYGAKGNIYYRNVESKKPAKRVAKNANLCGINEKGTSLLYISGGKLCRTNLKKADTLDKKVSSVIAVSENLKKIVYTKSNDDGTMDLWLCNGKKTTVLEKGVSEAVANEDLSIVYFIEDGKLSYKKGTKDAKEIAEDVVDIDKVYDNKVYYTVREENEEEGTSVESVCYFDGKKAEELAEDAYFTDFAYEKPVVLYKVNVDKEKDEREAFIAVEGNVIELDKDVANARLDLNGKTLYYMEKKTSEEEYEAYENGELLTTELYSVKISGKKLGKEEQIDKDVDYEMGFGLDIKSGFCWYYKDVDDEKNTATLCANGKEIDDEVRASRVEYSPEKKVLAYYKDWDSIAEGLGGGTLYFSKNGKAPVKVADEVTSFAFFPNGHIAYITNVSEKTREGDLYINKLSKKESKKPIDEDVSVVATGFVLGQEPYAYGYYY